MQYAPKPLDFDIPESLFVAAASHSYVDSPFLLITALFLSTKKQVSEISTTYLLFDPIQLLLMYFLS
jgi:hypothetical protein